MGFSPTILSNFVTLLVTIGPVETAIVFASLTAAFTARNGGAWPSVLLRSLA
jgi:small neutral amino acid transporter SnatA (MarC family)